MRILFVAFSTSIHTVRVIRQLEETGWDLHLFPSQDFGAVHPEMPAVTVHHSVYGPAGCADEARGRGWFFRSERVAARARDLLSRVSRVTQAGRLARLIDRLKPDVVHSMEFQHGAYLTLEAKARVTSAFPPWMVSNWGSDVFLFGRLEAHKARIGQVLTQCDFYACECQRDVALARELGLRGDVVPVMPNTGGFDLDAAATLRVPGSTSARKVIMVKGYQHWAGRALVVLRALERCADRLAGYTIVVYSPLDDVALAAELLAARTGLSVRLLPLGVAHREILALHGQARLSIAASIGDGVSTSFLEALVMGSFPIQSHTSCASEWIEDGVGGFLVPPEDPEHIERAIRRALDDDELVDNAARLNWETACRRLDARSIRPRVQQMYRDIVNSRVSTGRPS
jgi:hypothetical protein